VTAALRFVGPFNFQVVRTKGQGDDVLIEINPRYSGGAPLSIEAGWDAPLWCVDLFEGKEPRPARKLRDGLHMLRYHTACYLEAGDIGFFRPTSKDSSGKLLDESVDR
jgi:carbamoyl-phosphate synthase large subunit